MTDGDDRGYKVARNSEGRAISSAGIWNGGGGRFPVGKSAGLISEHPRGGQTQMLRIWAGLQKRAARTAIASVLESPRAKAERQLLLPM